MASIIGKAIGALARADGWANVFTGMGIRNRDKTVATKAAPAQLISTQEATSVYVGGGLGRRIVDLPAETMTREWLEVETEDKETGKAITARLDELNAKEAITNAVRWSRLYGGALVIIGFDDGAESLAEPLNEATIRNVTFLHTFDRTEVNHNATVLYREPTSPRYGLPEIYTINPAGGSMFTVHESRVLRFEGDPLPRQAWRENQCWGASVLQSCIDALKQTGTGYHAALTIMTEFILGVLTVKDLGDLIQSDSGNEALMSRLNILDMSKSNLNTIVVDVDEKFERQSATVTGMADLMDRFIRHLSAVSGIPVNVLMGQSPAGLNATGDSDIRNWYDCIKAEQEDRILPAANKLVRFLLISKEGPTRGKEPADWRVVFRPLWQMTAKECAEIDKIKTESAVLLVESAIADVDEARKMFTADGAGRIVLEQAE
jgi:phage-related protein (TIGR01555 family)